jgi:hypothetical protein
VCDHSTHLPAELQARITAARATVDTYRREVDRYLAGSGPAPHWDDWAPRLAGVLLTVLDEIESVTGGDPQAGVAQPGGGWLSGPCLP